MAVSILMPRDEDVIGPQYEQYSKQKLVLHKQATCKNTMEDKKQTSYINSVCVSSSEHYEDLGVKGR